MNQTFCHTAETETPILVIVLACLGALLVISLAAALIFVCRKAKKKKTVALERTNELEMDVQLPKDDNGTPVEVRACNWKICFLTHIEPIKIPLQKGPVARYKLRKAIG